MTTQQAKISQSKTARLLHGSFVTGIVLFAIIAHFVVRPTMREAPFPALVTNGLLGVSLAAYGASLLLRKRIPQRSTDESSDLFWSTAMTPALIAWASIELGCLQSVVAYMLAGPAYALGVAGAGVLAFLVMRPARLEKA